MKLEHPGLSAPVYLKTDKDEPRPSDPFFYYITGDGIFKCRNNMFFKSSVKVDKLPGTLAEHTSKLTLEFPIIPKALIERVVGFFSLIHKKQNSEAAVVLVWNTLTSQVEIVCPPQRATVTSGWKSSWDNKEYKGSPLDVFYEIPELPPHLIQFGDIHSHVTMSAFTSWTDENDEVHRPGIHAVVGRIDQEPPHFHIEACVDGMRFSIKDTDHIWEPYEKRDELTVPPEWIDMVKLEVQKSWWGSKDSTSEFGDREDIGFSNKKKHHKKGHK